MSFGLKCVACLFLSFSFSLGAQASLAREGGISGGGGNVINPPAPNEPMDLEHAEHVVRASLPLTRLFFARAHKQYQAGQAPQEILNIYQRLFSGSKSIHAVLKTVQPQVREHRPCYDYDQKPVDASIASSVPNRFCISSFALSRKVHPKFIAIQAAALMVHEYTEIMGLGEEEAVLIQTQALKDLQQSQDFN